VVGDMLYGAPREIAQKSGTPVSLPRNFLHAAALQFVQPRTGEAMSFSAPLPQDLSRFLTCLE
jgi:23S rRNA pseudouridine1911/1915/1917 synthase